MFGQIVHQVYQCTEGFLGITCKHGTLHLNEDLVAIQKEYLDLETKKFMPIITDFHRTTQPILRYRLDDILTERQTPCPCGSVMTAIEQIEGRRDDIFYFPHQTQNTLVPVFPDFIRRAIITASAVIQDYTVVQKSPQHLEIALKLPNEFATEIQDQVHHTLCKTLEQVGCQIPEIRYNDYQPPTNYAQKLRRVQRVFRYNS